jgi:hypothetical protein
VRITELVVLQRNAVGSGKLDVHGLGHVVALQGMDSMLNNGIRSPRKLLRAVVARLLGRKG